MNQEQQHDPAETSRLRQIGTSRGKQPRVSQKTTSSLAHSFYNAKTRADQQSPPQRLFLSKLPGHISPCSAQTLVQPGLHENLSQNKPSNKGTSKPEWLVCVFPFRALWCSNAGVSFCCLWVPFVFSLNLTHPLKGLLPEKHHKAQLSC